MAMLRCFTDARVEEGRRREEDMGARWGGRGVGRK